MSINHQLLLFSVFCLATTSFPPVLKLPLSLPRQPHADPHPSFLTVMSGAVQSQAHFSTVYAWNPATTDCRCGHMNLCSRVRSIMKCATTCYIKLPLFLFVTHTHTYTDTCRNNGTAHGTNVVGRVRRKKKKRKA